MGQQQIEAKINNVWKRVKKLQTHMPQGKRPLAFTVQDIETEKAYVIEATDTRTVLEKK